MHSTPTGTHGIRPMANKLVDSIFDITPQTVWPLSEVFLTQVTVPRHTIIRNGMSSRTDAASHVRSDSREQPKPKQKIEGRGTHLICPPAGMILFSAAHLHETVPNTSGIARYSIDFRTVHLDDVLAHNGARNLDSRCTGTTMRDYLRCMDLQHIPATAAQSYDGGTKVAGDLPALGSGVVASS